MDINVKIVCEEIKGANVFDNRFNEIEVIEEPYKDLKIRQQELMSKWDVNPNNIVNLRDALM
ncbi:hypothetical protein GLW08_19610 [Pontibacillus yanchengensis]|uniref:Uncharacterized protein n=2 Tax=Pontibacillus yanchengensis TaxID=462910 RepID=A0ACC7VLG7_9BACI|nr:hypothetical protein [Pontibacillus yanchengensis]MYL55515.1 hypothetical protein [Pontibacillus yanchengensis]